MAVISTASLNGDGPATTALAGGIPQRVGAFSFSFADERWEWSAEVSEMHGYGPVAMNPTTQQVLGHRHPDDQQVVTTTLDQIRSDRGAFSARHRVVDTRGDVRDVIVVGDQMRDERGVVVGTRGFYVDVTAAVATDAFATRAVIEQAKGMLGAVYGIDGDAAFDVLRWRSQTTNTKLRALAQQLIVDFRSVSTESVPSARSTYDRLLLTGHERVQPS